MSDSVFTQANGLEFEVCKTRNGIKASRGEIRAVGLTLLP